MQNYTYKVHKLFLAHLRKKKYLTAKAQKQFESGLDLMYETNDIVQGSLTDYLSLTKEDQDVLGITVYETKKKAEDPPSQEILAIVDRYIEGAEEKKAYSYEGLEPYIQVMKKSLPLAEHVNIGMSTHLENGKQNVYFDFRPKLHLEQYSTVVGLDEEAEQYIKNPKYFKECVFGQTVDFNRFSFKRQMVAILKAIQKPVNCFDVDVRTVVRTQYDKLTSSTPRVKGVGATNSDVYYEMRFEFDAQTVSEEDCKEIMTHVMQNLAGHFELTQLITSEKEVEDLLRENPSRIAVINCPTIRYQEVAVTADPNVIALIDYPADSVCEKALRADWRLIDKIKNPSEAVKRYADWLNPNTDEGEDMPNIIEEELHRNPYAVTKYKTLTTKQQLVAVKQNPSVIQYIETPRSDVIDYVLNQDGLLIRYIKEPTEHEQLLALKNNIEAYGEIKKPTEKALQYTENYYRQVDKIED